MEIVKSWIVLRNGYEIVYLTVGGAYFMTSRVGFEGRDMRIFSIEKAVAETLIESAMRQD